MDKVPLPDSDRQEQLGSRRIGVPSPDERFTITIVLRPRSSNGERFPLRSDLRILSREEFTAMHGADPQDIAKIESYARENNLSVESSDQVGRAVKLSGTVADFSRAFQVDLALYEFEGQQFRGRVGPIYVPPDLVPLVQGIFGLDNRQIARPGASNPLVSNLYAPVQVAAAYHFPPGVNGTGQTIGILEFGGGYQPSDLSTYFTGLVPSPTIVDVSVDGATNNFNPTDPNYSLEVTGDIEVAGAIAPRATYAIYFAPNTDQGWIHAVYMAIHDTTNNPSVISISWGIAESANMFDAPTKRTLDGYFQDAATLGITVLVASGDWGSLGTGDISGVSVDFPASSPHVTACGGTVLTLSGWSAVANEVVWNTGSGRASGGGVSSFFSLPGYQLGAGVPSLVTATGLLNGRGVPDVAGHADSYLTLFNGASIAFGGTSAVAPLWAGLIALINQLKGVPVGFLNPVLYGRLGPAGALNDIVSGTNGAYTAGIGWDACTGWGSPNGTLIAILLAPPSVKDIIPAEGPVSGDTPITIRGCRFIGATMVDFSNALVPLVPPEFSVDLVFSDTQINVLGTPTAITAGTGDVMVTTPYGSSTPSTADQFTYFFPIPNVRDITPRGGSLLGGDTVTITGSGFTGATSVNFCVVNSGCTSVPLDPSSIFSDTLISVTTPEVANPGSVHVTVTTPGGTSSPTSADLFTYQ